MASQPNQDDFELEASLLESIAISNQHAPHTRLCSSGSRKRLNLARLNIPASFRLRLYVLHDIFTTLVHCRPLPFTIFFFLVYITTYLFWAALYMTQHRKHCISNANTYLHALWFSVHTGATIGYGHMSPNPDCLVVNLTIMAQIITSALVQAALLGVVFARFSSPVKRATAIKFSSKLTITKETVTNATSNGDNDGGGKVVFKLSCRIGNLRKQVQLLRPEVTMLYLSLPQDTTTNNNITTNTTNGLSYRQLKVEKSGGALWLGIPAIISHIINEDSPLYPAAMRAVQQPSSSSSSLPQQQQQRNGGHAVVLPKDRIYPSSSSSSSLFDVDGEVVVLVDGWDESSARPAQARASYLLEEDVIWGEKFRDVLMRTEEGTWGIDFSQFDATVPL